MNHKLIYDQLIQKRRDNPATKAEYGYIENHHVVPRAEGGEDCRQNIVSLTAREHYIAHLLLAKIYDDVAMHSAVMFMQSGRPAKRKFRYNSKLYQKLRIEFGRKSSEYQKRTGCNTRENNPMYGKKLFDLMTEEGIARWKENHSAGCAKRRGVPSGMKGKRHSDRSKLQISATLSECKWWNNGVQQVRSKDCPDGFVHGRLKLTKQHRERISEGSKKRPPVSQTTRERLSSVLRGIPHTWAIGRHWYNNGIVNVF